MSKMLGRLDGCGAWARTPGANDSSSASARNVRIIRSLSSAVSYGIRSMLAWLLAHVHRPVAGNLGLEIAEADPLQALIEVHFRDGHRTPVLGLRGHGAGMVIDGGDHPVP